MLGEDDQRVVEPRLGAPLRERRAEVGAEQPGQVTAVVSFGGLRLTPLLVPSALVGSALCVPALRAPERQRTVGTGTTPVDGPDDRASFVKLSPAVVCRSSSSA